MHKITTLCISVLNSPRYWIALITLSTFLRLLPTPITLMADDYLHFAVTTGSQVLFDKGLTNVDPSSGFLEKLTNYFNFFDTTDNNLHHLKQYGVIPWWTDETAKINFYRPLSALTHWIDYSFWPRNTTLMRFENLACLILLLIVIFKFYRFHGTTTTAALAALCYTFDPSHQESILWIASRNAFMSTALGVVAILAFIRWRESQRIEFFLGCLLSLLASLLTAEAGIGAFAYIIAYVLWLDEKPIWRRLAALLGPLLLIVIWRITYTNIGYGSENVAHYIDPGRNLFDFIERSLYKLPLLIAGLSVGFELSAARMSLAAQQTHWVLCFIVSVITLLLFLPLILRDKYSRFWASGALLALIPACVINEITARTYAFSAIGFFMLFAQWVTYVFSQTYLQRSYFRDIALKFAASLAIFYHVVFASALFLYIAFNNFNAFTGIAENRHPDQLLEFYNISNLDYEDKTVFFVNAPFTFTMQFIPYRLLYEEQSVPEGLRVMAPGHTSITLERIDQHAVLVNAPGGYNILSNHEAPYSCHMGLTHHSRMLMGFFRKDDRDFTLGQHYEFAQSTIEVTELLDGLPLQTKWTMQLPIESEQYLFVAWDWQKGRYYPLTMPDIGGRITIKGPFEVGPYENLACGSS